VVVEGGKGKRRGGLEGKFASKEVGIGKGEKGRGRRDKQKMWGTEKR
jgi:hypothetical protein